MPSLYFPSITHSLFSQQVYYVEFSLSTSYTVCWSSFSSVYTLLSLRAVVFFSPAFPSPFYPEDVSKLGESGMSGVSTHLLTSFLLSLTKQASVSFPCPSHLPLPPSSHRDSEVLRRLSEYRREALVCIVKVGVLLPCSR